MKKIILIILLHIPLFAVSQTFYVSGKDNKSREQVIEKIKYEGYRTSSDSITSDYTVQLLVDGEFKMISVKRLYQGYIRFIDNKTGQEVGRTRVVKKNPSAFNGYNASYSIFSTICKKYLIAELKKVVTKPSTEKG